MTYTNETKKNQCCLHISSFKNFLSVSAHTFCKDNGFMIARISSVLYGLILKTILKMKMNSDMYYSLLSLVPIALHDAFLETLNLIF